jgi:hypothetical protein
MIFLTEDKRVRKEIMQNLVNAYISDLSRYQYVPETEEEEIPEAVEPVTPEEVVPEEAATEAVEAEAVETEAEEIGVEVDEPDTPQEFEDIMSSSEGGEEESEEAYDPYKIENIVTPEDVDLSETESYEEEEIEDAYVAANDNNRTKGLNIITLILSSILLVLLAFIVYSFIYLPLSNGISITDNFTNLFSFLKG